MAGVPANIRTFIAPLTGPGRLAPTLIEDLALHDPEQASKPNLLRDNPFIFTRGKTLGDQVPPDGCRHEWWLKPRQSNLPAIDELPTPDTEWRAALMCCRCRVHLTVDINYTIRWQSNPCPNAVHPLHHFIHSNWREQLESSNWEQDYPGRPSDISVFDCSSETCSASVAVRYTPPEIEDDKIEILVNKDKLKERTQAAFRTQSGNTQGMKQPLPIDVLQDLRVYVSNAWDKDPSHRFVKLTNKRFVVRFGPSGEACKDVLEYLGFRFDESQECWHVPEPDMDESLPLENAGNVILDNFEQELLALIYSRPAEELQHNPDLPKPVLVGQELQRLLSCQAYERHPTSRRMTSKGAVAAEARTQPYNTLGVPQDAADNLVIKAYRNQMLSGDPKHFPFYLDCLQTIATERSSELIQEESAMEQSKGRYDSRTLNNAFKSIGLDLMQDQSYDDEYILGMFNSRLEDMRMHERELRDNLKVIGDYRASRMITDTAENTMTTNEQALRFLGADANVSDDQITALFGAKVGDNKTLEVPAMNAVRLIADHRRSPLLHNWINTGFVGTLEMSAAEGFQTLQIENRTVEDELIVSQFDVLINDNPGIKEQYTKALEAIAKDRDSSFLRGHLQRTSPHTAQGKEDEPVGLENIGNTCYLNSLLQFLFTMVELRNIVLNFDNYKMDTSQVPSKPKKVGQRSVSDREIQIAQKFIQNLAILFKNMIETPQSAIRPEKELARLTLETPGGKERVRRKSTIMSGGERPSLGQIDGTVFGPPPNPQTQVNGVVDDPAVHSPQELVSQIVDLGKLFSEGPDDQPMSDAEADSPAEKDNSSEATLVSRPGSINTPVADTPTIEQQQEILDNKENLSPMKEALPTHFDAEDTQPLRPASPSKVNAQAGALSKQGNSIQEANPPIVYSPPPGKPPPVPPRKPVEPLTDILEEYARQQDVAEVLAHCLVQFSCAMRPTGVDQSGEQLDEVHDMFFGQSFSHVQGSKDAPVPVQFFSVVARVAQEPKDVYAAIDTDYDLVTADNNTSAFSSMTKPPPVFSIALNRVVWDNDVKRAKKLNHHVELPQTIFLDRYLESAEDSELMKRRRQTWRLKQELATLTDRRKILEEKHANTDNLPQLYDHTRRALEHLQSLPNDTEIPLDISPTLISTFTTMSENLQTELDSIKTRITTLQKSINESFADMRKHPYRLHAAFFHRGGASGGHYWVYIYDHLREIWRCYNDDRVSAVNNLNDIFGKPPETNAYGLGVPANPYFLVYVREDMLGDGKGGEGARGLVESVRREIVYPPPVAPPPTFSGFGASIPTGPRNQMDAMRPDQGWSGDVEMIEYAHGGGNGVGMDNVNGTQTPENFQREDKVLKEGDWDDSELMHRPRGGW